MIYAGILAAGVGARMHRQDLPKQFLNLGSKPIIIQTLEQFYINAKVGKVIVVAPEDWTQYAEDLINQYDNMGTEISVIVGGINKTISVKAVVEYITQNYGINDDDILITHDAVRPFITQRMIDDNIETAKKYGAASTVVATNDTIVVSNDGKTLSEVPLKAKMLAEQTPSTFNLKMLSEMFHKVVDNRASIESETELARLYISQGYSMRLVDGEYSNMKIINPYDLEVAEALLRERKV
ncbi:D-ribitol-5-phosphate cytidylyltransferase [Anaerocolumna chitinilytica]|uniref:2-C-methyl-D-erythritol 4-phosphate cytidylyltransferase n=1 Tax=Anaerocolumna chitinilytica TaxID=1727145 RepID=A0A7M3S9E9_9FIRM|nr:D-ribitol-5-phosphate cytidylyltransferase [Anaerocolumna chitinilytica]BCK01217.1 2-C-methyl-D-erythritol 4-phosphate cytidylyltransferase [Anaerocolumna chitinilytica]